MVRLVFRPYTQVWRTICTSVSLPPSTRVSPGFGVLKRSSPSFGSYQACSCSSPSLETQGRPQLHCYSLLLLDFSARSGFSTLSLAWLVHSLVRVSRRVSWRRRFNRFSRRNSLDAGAGFWNKAPGKPGATLALYSRPPWRPICLLRPNKTQPSVAARALGLLKEPSHPPAGSSSRQYRPQVTALQPLPTQRFQVF